MWKYGVRSRERCIGLKGCGLEIEFFGVGFLTVIYIRGFGVGSWVWAWLTWLVLSSGVRIRDK